MNWPDVGKRWGPLLAGVGLCAASFGLNARARQAGTQARWAMLLPCHLFAVLVLLLAWWVVYNALAAGWPVPPDRSFGRRLLGLAGGVLIVAACCSLYPVLPVVAIVLPLFLGALFARRQALGPQWKGIVLRAALAVLLFEATWYECATRSWQAMLGLGERIETHGGSERLMAWAQEVLAATPPNEGRTLLANEVPDFVVDMMGRIPGWPVVYVYNDEEPKVWIVNGSGYGFGITVRPKHMDDEVSPWWAGEYRWRPGVYLGTVSK
jgi:hypothetical protein